MEKEKGLYVFKNWDVLGSICETASVGATHTKRAIDETFRSALLREIESGSFEKAPEVVGAKNNVVRQNFERFGFFENAEPMPYLETLRVCTGRMIRSVSTRFSGLADWDSNDIVVQKYGLDGYLTPHRDHSECSGVIVIFTLAGEALFELLGDTRESSPVQTYHLHAGDLVLLRGPGVTDLKKNVRPFHAVREVVGDQPRISATFRKNTDPERALKGGEYGYNRDHRPYGTDENRSFGEGAAYAAVDTDRR